MHTNTLTGGLFEQRPVSMQEIADAHDTLTFVLADNLRMRLDFRYYVRLTAMRPHAYVPCTIEPGWALWTSPEWRIYHYLPYHTENRFAFEITADFTHYEMNQPYSGVVPRKPIPPRPMTDTEAADRLHRIESAALCAGANRATLRIDFDRRVVTGEYLYLPDHPVVTWVRAFGTMPYVDSTGTHFPARGTVYIHPGLRPEPKEVAPR